MPFKNPSRAREAGAANLLLTSTGRIFERALFEIIQSARSKQSDSFQSALYQINWDLSSLVSLLYTRVNIQRRTLQIVNCDFNCVLKIENNFKSHYFACFGLLSTSTFQNERNWVRVIGTLKVHRIIR